MKWFIDKSLVLGLAHVSQAAKHKHLAPRRGNIKGGGGHPQVFHELVGEIISWSLRSFASRKT